MARQFYLVHLEMDISFNSERIIQLYIGGVGNRTVDPARL